MQKTFRKILYYGLLLALIGFSIKNFSYTYPLMIVFLIEFLILRKSSFFNFLKFKTTTESDLWVWALQSLNLLSVISFQISSQFIKVPKILVLPEFPVAQFLLALVIYSFVGYVFHWLCHKIPELWELHKIHHSAEEMITITSFREHIILTAMQGVLVGFAFHLFGLSMGALGVFLVFKNAQVHFLHSQIRTSLGPLGFIFASPQDHWIHHSQNPKHYDKNFSTDFIIWDKLFKTYYKSDKNEEIKFGLPVSDYKNEFVLFEMIRTFVNAIKVFAKRLNFLFRQNK